MRNKFPWQAAALVGLLVVWVAWRWIAPEPYETRVFDPEGSGQEITTIGDTDIPTWVDLPAVGDVDDPILEGDLGEVRLERDRWRSEVLEALKGVISDPKTAETTRDTAQGRLIALTERAATETKLERLMGSQGLGKVLCILYDETAVVLVEGVTPQEAHLARLLDLVSGVTGLAWEQITVVGSSP